MKYLRINLTKEVQDLDTESCKTLLKDILEDLNKWKNIHIYELERQYY